MNSASLDFVPRADAPAWSAAPVRLGGVDAKGVSP
jgi:hypothetical protein